MSARITVAASSCGGTSRSDPPNPPTGVRSGSQMTASRTVVLPGLVTDHVGMTLPSSVRVCPRGDRAAQGPRRNRSGDLTGVRDLLRAEQVPEPGDLQRADDGAGAGEHAQPNVLTDGAAVRRGQHAQAGRVEEGDASQVDGEFADLGVEQ